LSMNTDFLSPIPTISKLIYFCKFKTLAMVLCFLSISINAQKDSLEVERLLIEGEKISRIAPVTSKLHFEKALQIINDSILPKNKEDHYFLLKKALILDNLSYFYRLETNIVSSLKAIQESLKIKEDIGETTTLAKTYHLLGRVYRYQKDSVKTIQYYTKALALAKTNGNSEEIVNILNGHGSFYNIYSALDKAKVYIQKAYHYADSIDYKRGKATANYLFSANERRRKNYKNVIFYSNKDLEISTSINDKIGMERSYKELGNAYRKLKQPKKALSYYKKSLNLVTEMQFENRLANRYLSVSNAYYDLKKFEDAFYYYRFYKRQQIKDLNVKSIKEFAELDAKYDYEKRKTIDSIQLVERLKIEETLLIEKTSTRFWKITTTIIIAFSLIFTTILLLLRRKREQVRLGKFKNELLENEIKYKQKDISDFALNISRNRKWREELLSYIKKVKKSSAVKDDSHFKALEKAILDREIVDNHTIDFQNKVDILNTAFYEKLNEKYPTLTKSEVKLCSFIRLHIDNNEIATLQNVAIESVYRSRSRLRKKLNLTSEDDLDTFLSKI